MLDPPDHDVLLDARARKVPWARVADALLESEARSLTTNDGRPWVRAAADLSGYTTNQLRRMTRVVGFVRRLAAEGFLDDVAVLDEMPFSHLETAMRIHAFDPGAALRVFRREWTNPSYPGLLAFYQGLREGAPTTHAPNVAGKRAARRFQDESLQVLRTVDFFGLGPDRRLGRMGHPSRYANPDFLVVTRRAGDVTRVEAVDCYAMSGPSSDDQVPTRVLHVAVESTFFDVFWIVLPDVRHADAFAHEARLLGLGNVGIVVVDLAANEVRERVRPGRVMAVDRRRLWLDHAPSRLP